MKISVALRGIPGTSTAAGLAGGHCVVADRPAGRAGGQGLGLNGGQLLALSIGGCLWNDLYYAAAGMGATLASLVIDVEVALGGEPLRVTGATVLVDTRAEEPAMDVAALVAGVCRASAVANSVTCGFPVAISAAAP